MWMLGIGPSFSGRAAIALTHQAVSLGPGFVFLNLLPLAIPCLPSRHPDTDSKYVSVHSHLQANNSYATFDYSNDLFLHFTLRAGIIVKKT